MEIARRIAGFAARQVDGGGVHTPLGEPAHDALPAPRTVPCTGNEHHAGRAVHVHIITKR